MTAAFFFGDYNQRLERVGGRATIAIEGSTLTIEDYSLSSELGRDEYDLKDYYSTRFYQDFLIPPQEFYKDRINDPGIDFFQIVIDPDQIAEDVFVQNKEYRADAIKRLNAFFGTTYEEDDAFWRLLLKGQYALVFSVDSQNSREENLALLAELDKTEGLSVTGIYYVGPGTVYNGAERVALCLPLREDDPVNPETLDPRESLRVLAANQKIANMLLQSELYGGPAIDFQALMNMYGLYDSDVSFTPLGACVLVKENSFLTPAMAEAIAKVSERCIDVKLISRDL